MKQEFLIGFIKQALESGYSDDQIQRLWKTAMEYNESREMFNSFKEAEDTMNPLELEILSNVKSLVEKRAYIDELKQIIATV